MNERPIVVGLGEVLWDVFPDGARFGGAPANFACCAAELSRGRNRVVLASAVGNDSLGEQALAELRQHDVDISVVSQIDFPTSTVDVRVDEHGQANYEFASNVAWDHLNWSEKLGELAASCDVVCFGTLAQRSEKTRETIRNFLAATNGQCFRLLDINLRPPYYTPELLLHSLSMANCLKLNDVELPIVAELLSLQGTEEELLLQIMRQYSMRFAALTRGGRGSLLLSATGERCEQPVEPVRVVDTVGAGDAFTACIALGLLQSMPIDAMAIWANRVAAYVCTHAGATPKIEVDPDGSER